MGETHPVGLHADEPCKGTGGGQRENLDHSVSTSSHTLHVVSTYAAKYVS